MIWTALLIAAGCVLLGAALLRQPAEARTGLSRAMDEEMRDCPRCGLAICSTARMCRWCGQVVVPGLD